MSDRVEGEMMHCGICGAEVESRKDGNRHIRDDHSILDVLKYDLLVRDPPIQCRSKKDKRGSIGL